MEMLLILPIVTAKNKYSFILTVVSLCVLALIVVQVLWMRNVLELKNEQFDRDAQIALDALAADFDDDIFCNELFTNIKLNPGQGLQLFHKEWYQDSSGLKFWKNDEPSDTVSFYLSDRDNLLQTYRDLKFRYPATVQVMLRINTWIDSGVVFDTHEYLDKTDKSQMPDAEHFKKFVAAHHNPAELFTGGYIDSTLKDHLAEKNIRLDFEYLVQDTTGEQIYAPDSANINTAGYELSTLLLKDNYFFDPFELSVHFPNRMAYLWSSIKYILIISIVVIISLIASFYAFVRYLRKQMELNKMKSNFVNNMTHEFKTPTANISLAMENIGMLNGDVKPKLKKYLRIIGEENERMITNVERILEVAKYSESKDAKLVAHRFDVHEAIEEINERFCFRVQKAEGEYHWDFKAKFYEVEGDRHHFKNCISNVLDNALKYCDGKPKIELSTINKGEFLEIHVKDNGVGIDREDEKRIFEAFYRKDTGNLHNVKGFGLGLSYVKRVVDMHGGQVLVNSKQGKGSEFILRFYYAREVEPKTV